MPSRTLPALLSGLIAAGCSGGADVGDGLPPVRDVVELPVQDARELRVRYAREMRAAGYADDTLVPPPHADGTPGQGPLPTVAGYVPAKGTLAGWSATLLRSDALEWNHAGQVGTVRRRLAHPTLSRAGLSLTIAVAQHAALDAHWLMLNDLKHFIDGEPLKHYSGDAPIGDAGFVARTAWTNRDADRAIQHLHFVRHNVYVALGWIVARTDRAEDNDRFIVEVARAIDDALLSEAVTRHVTASRHAPKITGLTRQRDEPIRAADPDARGVPDGYAVTAEASTPGATTMLLAMAVGDEAGRIWPENLGVMRTLDAPGVFEFVPGSRPGRRTLYAFAVNERGLVATKTLAVDVLPFGDGSEDASGDAPNKER